MNAAPEFPGWPCSAPPPCARRGPGGARRRWAAEVRAVAGLLVAALVLHGVDLLAACPFDSRRPGYLAVIGIVPLRFEAEASPVAHPAEPVPAASSDPKAAVRAKPAPVHPTPVAVATTPPRALPPAAAVPSPPRPAPAPLPPPPPAAAPEQPLPLEQPVGPVRPEDFLPFFQQPGTTERPAGAIFVLPPAVRRTNELPLSSATYTQSPP